MCPAAKTYKRSLEWIPRILNICAKSVQVVEQGTAVTATPLWVIAVYSTHHKFSSRTLYNDGNVEIDTEKIQYF